MNSAAKLGIERLYRICGVDDPPDFIGEGKKWDDLIARPTPTLADSVIALAPEAGLEHRQCLFGGGIDGTVDGLQGRSARLTVFSRHKINRVSQHIDDAVLNHRFGEDGGDGVGKPLRPSTTASMTSSTPRLRSSFTTRSQNLVPLFYSCHSPRTILVLSAMTPRQIWIALLRTMPSSKKTRDRLGPASVATRLPRPPARLR